MYACLLCLFEITHLHVYVYIYMHVCIYVCMYFLQLSLCN